MQRSRYTWPTLGEADAPRGAIEQAGAEVLFQLHDRLADLGAGQPDLVCRRRKPGALATSTKICILLRRSILSTIKKQYGN